MSKPALFDVHEGVRKKCPSEQSLPRAARAEAQPCPVALAKLLVINESANLINYFNPCVAAKSGRSSGKTVKHSVMAPVHVPNSQRTQDRAMAQGYRTEIEELSQPGSQSSNDNQVTKLATEMHREVLLCSSLI